jgi:hypothetical protein
MGLTTIRQRNMKDGSKTRVKHDRDLPGPTMAKIVGRQNAQGSPSARARGQNAADDIFQHFSFISMRLSAKKKK